MTTWTLLFEPVGVLLFRDDRPFDAGQHALAVSRFPLPSVFRGAVRTALFELAGADFDRHPDFGLGPEDRELLGSAEQPEVFALRGPMVARTSQDRADAPVHGPSGTGYEYVFPWPRDLAIVDVPSESGTLAAEVVQTFAPQGACLRLDARQGDGSRSLAALPGALPWTRERRAKRTGTPWLTAAGARRYINQAPGEELLRLGPNEHIEQHDFLVQETRVGTARAHDRLVAADMMLYTITAWRMCPNYRFAVEVDVELLHTERLRHLLQRLDGRLVHLGGKSGLARVTVLDGSIAPDGKQPAPKEAPQAKLWLWTPGLFDVRSLPGAPTVLGDTLRLGGFDMAKHQPHPLRHALDRGSVIRFSALDPQALTNHQKQLAQDTSLPLASYSYGRWIPGSQA